MAKTASQLRDGTGEKTEIRHKTVERMAGAWYYHSIVSLFIEGEAYEQEKSSIESENNRPLLQDFP